MNETQLELAEALAQLDPRGRYCAVFLRMDGPAHADAGEALPLRCELAQVQSALDAQGLGDRVALSIELEPGRALAAGPWLEGLRRGDVAHRQRAALVLGTLPLSAAEARGARREVIEALVAALEDDEGLVREAALESLSALSAASDLQRQLTDPDPSLREAAARALGRLKAQAREAIPSLIDALRDPEDEVRKAAAWALERIFTNGAAPPRSQQRVRYRSLPSEPPRPRKAQA